MKQESRGGWRSEHKMDNMDSRELGHCVVEEGMSRLSLENPGELESGSPRKREVSMRPGEALTTSESKGNPMERCKQRNKAHEQRLQTMRNLNSSVIGSRAQTLSYPEKCKVKL